MARSIRHHVRTRGPDSEHTVSAESAVTALTVFTEVMREILKSLPAAKAEIRFSELQVGSLIATIEYEISLPGESAAEVAAQEQELEHRYVSGWATLANGPVVQPEGFTRKAIENVGKFVNLFVSDGFADLQISGQLGNPVTVTAHAIENVRQLLGESHTDIGAAEGRLETISLAGRPLFNVRDEMLGTIVTCAIGKISLDELKEGLGRRVLVHGEITYDRNGLPSEISPVFSLDIIDKVPPVTIGDIIGIGIGLPGSELPSEQYVKRAWDGD